MPRSDPEAQAAYMRAYRASHEATRVRDTARARAYRRALSELRRRHLEEWSELYRHELEGIGL